MISRQIFSYPCFIHLNFLPGFKWLGSRAIELEQAESNLPSGSTKVLFAFEEAIGFMVGVMGIRDKDGVSAAAVFAEMAADYYSRGETVRGSKRLLRRRCSDP